MVLEISYLQGVILTTVVQYLPFLDTSLVLSFGSSKWAVPPDPYLILTLHQPWVLRVNEEPSIEITKAAWDFGINTIDTANAYSNGESELLVAEFIKKVGFENTQSDVS